jgi:hypothetical protein
MQMQSQVQSQVQSQSNMDIHTVNKNTYVELECSICYKSIQKSFAKCSAPCEKMFHTTCMEKMIQQTEENAYEEDKEAEHKCCYCRRSIDVNRYSLLDVVRRLMCLERGGYDVREAQQQVKKALDTNNDEDISYNIYFPLHTHYVKKPKQASSFKRSSSKRNAPKKINKPHIKQNIGGRRRS